MAKYSSCNKTVQSQYQCDSQSEPYAVSWCSVSSAGRNRRLMLAQACCSLKIYLRVTCFLWSGLAWTIIHPPGADLARMGRHSHSFNEIRDKHLHHQFTAVYLKQRPLCGPCSLCAEIKVRFLAIVMVCHTLHYSQSFTLAHYFWALLSFKDLLICHNVSLSEGTEKQHKLEYRSKKYREMFLII